MQWILVSVASEEVISFFWRSVYIYYIRTLEWKLWGMWWEYLELWCSGFHCQFHSLPRQGLHKGRIHYHSWQSLICSECCSNMMNCQQWVLCLVLWVFCCHQPIVFHCAPTVCLPSSWTKPYSSVLLFHSALLYLQVYFLLDQCDRGL